MKRRIVLSDDEDAGEMLASADISNVMQGKPSPPVSAKSDGKDSKKPVKKRRSRFNPDIDSAADDDEDDDDDDDDDDDGDESYDDDEDDERSKQRTAHKKSKKSSPESVSTAPRRKPSSRSSAARSSSSSSAKRLQEQRQELKRRGNGLKGVDSDSDEYSDDGEEKFTFSASGNRPSSLPRLSSGGGSSSVQSFFRGGNRDNDPLPRKKTRKAKTPEPSSEEDDNLDNFILNSDEEREEEEERQKALKRQRQKEKRLRQQKKDERDRQRSSESKPKKRSVTTVDEDDDDDDGKVVASGGRGRARSGGSSGKRRIRDEEDDEDEGEEEEPGPKAKSSKRRQVANSEGDDDDDEDGNKEEEEEDEEEDSDDDNDDDDDDDDDSVEQEDDALDGPMLYWQVDAAREKQHESQVTDAMPIRKNFPTPEALRLYIEMLANAHVDKDFVSRIVKSPHTSPNSSYVAAARQIENKICTIRESMVGSGAWNVKFMSELSKRPFYICSPASFYGLHEKCSACNRASKSTVKQIYLFGACYNAQRAWTSQRWDNEIPETAFLHRMQNDEIVELSSSEDEDNEEEEDEENDDIGDEESGDKDRSKVLPKACVWWKSKWPGALTSGKESRWMLSGHCCNRTQLYHTLLHYKLRLFLKVREKLERVGGSVGEAMRDASFISNEVTRYEKLLDTASKLYGGKDMESEFQSDVWGNEVPSDFATPSSQGRRSIGQFNTRGGGLDGQADGGNGGILGWIKKGQQ